MPYNKKGLLEGFIPLTYRLPTSLRLNIRVKQNTRSTSQVVNL